MIGLRIDGRGTFLDLQIAGRQMDATIRQAIRDLAREYEAALRGTLAAPKGGKRYGGNAARRSYRRVRRKVVVFGRLAKYTAVERFAKPTRAYTASAPGEAPAVLTGAELRAVKVRFPGREKGYGAKVYADKGVAFYRHFLEFGTGPRIQKRGRGGKVVNRAVGAIAPRPVFSPMQARLEADLVARVGRAVDLFVAFRG